MTISFIKLAYLAEFAVAFNLAFGEFKQDKTAKFLNEQFESLDKNCDVTAADILKYAQERAPVKPRYGELTAPTWLAQQFAALDRMRNERKVADPSYRPFQGFLRRLGVFTTDPQAVEGCSKLRILGMLLWGLPKGMLASLAYSSTENWRFPPCRVSVALWILGIFLCGGMAWWSVDSALAGIGGGVSAAGNLVLLRGWQISLGGAIALLIPRPLSIPAGWNSGRYPPSPRGRYYPLIMLILITVALLAITLAEATLTADMLATPAWVASWFVLFGFLLGALLMPMLMFSGFLALESALHKWASWLEDRAKLDADDSITMLEKTLVPKP